MASQKYYTSTNHIFVLWGRGVEGFESYASNNLLLVVVKTTPFELFSFFTSLQSSTTVSSVLSEDSLEWFSIFSFFSIVKVRALPGSFLQIFAANGCSRRSSNASLSFPVRRPIRIPTHMQVRVPMTAYHM